VTSKIVIQVINEIIKIVLTTVRMRLRIKYMDQYGSTFLAWLGPKPIVITRDPNIAKEVLLSSECLNRSSQVTAPFAVSVGHGLFSMEGTGKCALLSAKLISNAVFSSKVDGTSQADESHIQA